MESTPSVMPKSFIPTINRIKDFTRTRIQMNPIGLTTFGPYSTLVIQLADGICDLSTLSITGYALAKDSNTATPAATDTPVLLPAIEQFIDSMDVSIGGKTVCSINNYNQIFTTYNQYKSNDRWNLRSITSLQPGSKECTTGGDGNTKATASYVQPAIQNGVGFLLNTFLGFLGSVKILYTNRLPPVRITIRFASANIVAQGTTAGSTPSYSLQNLNAYCDYLTVSPEFNQFLSDRLSQGPLPIVFDNFQSQIGGPTVSLSTSNRISTNASCVENIWYTWIKTGYNAPGKVDPDTYNSPYFTHGIDELSTNCKNNGGYRVNFTINGKRIPEFDSDLSQMQTLHDTLVMMNEDHDCNSEVHANLNSLVKYSTKFFVHGRSLTYSDVDGKNRLMGIDSRGNSSEIYINTSSNSSGLNSQYNIFIVLPLKSVLVMYDNRVVDLIF